MAVPNTHSWLLLLLVEDDNALNLGEDREVLAHVHVVTGVPLQERG